MYRFKQIYECIYEQLDTVACTERNPEDCSRSDYI